MIIPTNCCGRWRQGRCSYCPVAKARDEAIARVTDHMKAEWKREALRSADRVMLRMESFTTDDIWLDLEKRGVEAPHEPRAMSAIVGILKRGGEIEFTGVRLFSVLTRGHAREVKLYKVMV